MAEQGQFKLSTVSAGPSCGPGGLIESQGPPAIRDGLVEPGHVWRARDPETLILGPTDCLFVYRKFFTVFGTYVLAEAVLIWYFKMQHYKPQGSK